MSSNILETPISLLNNLLEHLTSISHGTAVPVDYKLIDNACLILKGEISLYQNSENRVLDQLVLAVLSIIRSDNTTSEAKDASVQVLDCILSHYEFDQILEHFGMKLFIQGLESDKERLQILVIDILSRADPADIIANTSVVLLLVQILNDSESSIALVNETEKCLFMLASKGELVRRRIISDEVISNFRKIRTNPRVVPRLYDLVLKLLPIVPNIPDDLYLVTTQEITSSNDILMDSLTVSSYHNLLVQISKNISLRPILDRLGEQISYISRIFCDPTFKPEIGNGDYIDAASFLCELSKLSLQKFVDADNSYHIIEHAISCYLTHRSCRYLLSNINPSTLESETIFLKNFRLEGITTSIYCNLIQDPKILAEELQINTADIEKLSVSDFLEILLSLVHTKYGLHKLTRDWSPLITNLLDINDILDSDIWRKKLDVVRELYDKRSQIGVWSQKIVEAYGLMRNGHPITSEADVMDITGP